QVELLARGHGDAAALELLVAGRLDREPDALVRGRSQPADAHGAAGVERARAPVLVLLRLGQVEARLDGELLDRLVRLRVVDGEEDRALGLVGEQHARVAGLRLLRLGARALPERDRVARVCARLHRVALSGLEAAHEEASTRLDRRDPRRAELEALARAAAHRAHLELFALARGHPRDRARDRPAPPDLPAP